MGIPIQINTAANGHIAILFCLQDIEPLLQTLQLKVTFGIDLQRQLAIRSSIGQHKAFPGILFDAAQHDLAGNGFRSFGNSLCLSRYLHAFIRAFELQSNASVLIKGHIPDLLLAVDHNRGQCITRIGFDGDKGIHAGNNVGRSGNGVMLARLQRHRQTTHNAFPIETEVAFYIGKLCTVLLGIMIPIPIDLGICARLIVRGDVCRVYIHEAILQCIHIHSQPLHIIPWDEQFQAIAVAALRIDLAALGSGAQVSHNIIAGCHITKTGVVATDLTVAPLEQYVAGGKQIDLKYAVILHAFHIGRCKIQLNTAVHEGITIQIDIDGYAFCHIEHKVHTLLAIVTGHGDIDIVATFVIIQIQPVVVRVGFFIKNAIDDNVGIRLSLGLFRIHKGIVIFRRDIIIARFRIAAGQRQRQNQHEKQRS